MVCAALVTALPLLDSIQSRRILEGFPIHLTLRGPAGASDKRLVWCQVEPPRMYHQYMGSHMPDLYHI